MPLFGTANNREHVKMHWRPVRTRLRGWLRQSSGMIGLLTLVQGRGLVRIRGLLALFRLTRSLRKWHVLVNHVVHGQVALRDGVGAVGLVLLDKVMHVRSEDVLRVIVDVLLVSRRPEDRRAAAGAAANAHA